MTEKSVLQKAVPIFCGQVIIECCLIWQIIYEVFAYFMLFKNIFLFLKKVLYFSLKNWYNDLDT